MKLPAKYEVLLDADSAAGGLITDVYFEGACRLTTGCEGACAYSVAASLEGGLYGGPEPKYFHRAEPGEILHIHSVSCAKCGKHTDYTGDGVQI